MSLRSLIAKGFHSLRERKSCVDETKRLGDLVTGCSDSERENHVWRSGSKNFSLENHVQNQVQSHTTYFLVINTKRSWWLKGFQCRESCM